MLPQIPASHVTRIGTKFTTISHALGIMAATGGWKRPRAVHGVSDASTTGNSGETIGLIRVLTYEEPVAGSREHYQEKIESTLNEWGEEIEKISKKADRLGADARDKYRQQIEDLRARQETARKKLEDLKRTGGEAWEDLRHGAEAALDELKKGVEGAVAKLRKE